MCLKWKKLHSDPEFPTYSDRVAKFLFPYEGRRTRRPVMTQEMVSLNC